MSGVSHRRNIAAAAIPVAVGIYYALVTALSPLTGDDMRFLFDWNLYSDGGTSTFLTTLSRFVTYMRDFDNARLCNVFAFIALSCLPRWLTGVILGTCAAIIVRVGTRLSGRLDASSLLIFSACLILLMPWRNDGLSTVICFNILVTSALTLCFLRLITVSGRLTPVQLIPAALLSLVAGGVHEAYSVTAFIVAALYGYRNRLFRNRGFLILMTIFLAGVAWVCSSRGIISRAGNSDGSAGASVFGLMTMTLPLALLCITIPVALLKSRSFKLLASLPMLLPLGAAIVAGTAVAVVSGLANPRAWWVPDLYATVLLTGLLSQLRMPGKLLVPLLLVFCPAMIVVQYKSWNLHASLRKMVDTSPAGTVYQDYQVGSRMFLLLQPVTNVWHDWLHLFSTNYGRKDGRIEAVVPAVFARIDSAQSRAINLRCNPGPGFVPADRSAGWWQIGGEVVGPDSVMTFRNWNGEVTDVTVSPQLIDIQWPDGECMKNVEAHAQRFVTVDGDTLLHIRPLKRLRPGPYHSVSPSSARSQ